MINRLIDMNISVSDNLKSKIPKAVDTNYSITEYAKSFINGMGETQRNRFKKMLENGIQCGMSVAESYGIDYEEFIDEVKKQLNVKE
jgi:hypothetical protein